MVLRGCVFGIILLFAGLSAAVGELLPQDVVVVYNSSSAFVDPNTGRNTSKDVADYYCSVRGIPSSNKTGVYCPISDELISPRDFTRYILEDFEGHQGLRSFLSARPGFDVNDPATDPTKCIVLCYGIPILVAGSGRVTAVDSALCLLFGKTPWGREPIGAYRGVGGVTNPYYDGTSIHPAERQKWAEFDAFRASARNSTVESAPVFTKVRFLDPTHVVAIGNGGILYRREFPSGQWTAVSDTSKAFVAQALSDISVPDPVEHPMCAVVASDHGGVIMTTDGGVSWTSIRGPEEVAWLSSRAWCACSFISPNSGWIAGRWGSQRDRPRPHFVQRWPRWTDAWGNLPEDTEPNYIAAVSADEAWLSANNGMWHTTDGGANWARSYAEGGVGPICVRDSYGWAIAKSGYILRLDGEEWTRAEGAPVLAIDQAAAADLSVYDANHVAIAYGRSKFRVFNGTKWAIEDSGQDRASVAWAGDRVAAVSRFVAELSTGSASAGAFQWSDSYTVPAYKWKMRYMVCRLDAFAAPLDPQGTGVPLDIRRVIDRSVAAEAPDRGRSAIDEPGEAVFVLDESGLSFEAAEGAINGVLGFDMVERLSGQGYAVGRRNVIGYASRGSYDASADSVTAWWRPLNLNDTTAGTTGWLPGSVGLFYAVSGDAIYRGIRKGWYLPDVKRDTQPTNVAPGKVRVYFTRPAAAYSSHWAGLFGADGKLLKYTNGSDAKAAFSSTESICTVFSPGQPSNVRVAEIDLTSIEWTQTSTYAAICYPPDDPLSPNEVIQETPLSTLIYDQRDDGVTFGFKNAQSLSLELIREGCCGTTGNVIEPFGAFVPQPGVILPQYAAGRTWAESAHMGLPLLSWMEVVIGDPLMNPYYRPPSIEFEDPTPPEGSAVSGLVHISVRVSSATGPNLEVRVRVEEGGSSKVIWAAAEPPWLCAWDTKFEKDGSYVVAAELVKADSGVVLATSPRPVVVANKTNPTVQMYRPTLTEEVVDSVPSTVGAIVSGQVSAVQFWRITPEGAAMVGVGKPAASGNYYGTSIPFSGDRLDLQAVAIGGGTVSFSDVRSVPIAPAAAVRCATVGAMGMLTDGTKVYLRPTPVVAGTTPTMFGAFYVEDVSRASGIRVETTEQVNTGDLVAVLGTLFTAPIERYIAAERIWNLGPADEVPKPLAMSLVTLGGFAPRHMAGVHKGRGAYNVGLLVRTCGKVTYVDESCFYINDGSTLTDNSILSCPYSLSLRGKAVPDPVPHGTPRGVRVKCAGLSKPGLGDIVIVTGINSIFYPEEINRARCLLPRTQEDIAYVGSYTDCHADSSNGPLLDSAGNVVQPGSWVRVADSDIVAVDESQFSLIMRPYGCSVRVLAQTQLSGSYDNAIVTGILAEGGDIIADGVYLLPGNYEANQTVEDPWDAGSLFARGEATASLVPTFGRQLEHIASALAQPDGSIVNLQGESIVLTADKGRTLALRARSESGPLIPRLLLQLPAASILEPWNRIDVIGGRISTLPNGQRLISNPTAVYRWTSSDDRPMQQAPQPKERPLEAWRRELIYSRQ